MCRSFYQFCPRGDGLVDVWLTPGEPVPVWDANARLDFRFRVLAVVGVDPKDPQWGGNLEEHIRRHYDAWLMSAEEIEI